MAHYRARPVVVVEKIKKGGVMGEWKFIKATKTMKRINELENQLRIAEKRIVHLEKTSLYVGLNDLIVSESQDNQIEKLQLKYRKLYNSYKKAISIVFEQDEILDEIEKLVDVDAEQYQYREILDKRKVK